MIKKWTISVLLIVFSFACFAGDYEPFSYRNLQKYTEEHPELLWLATDLVQKTEEGTASINHGPSEKLFGKKYIEFDRAVMGLHCLSLIIDGSRDSYKTFTQDQNPETRLTWSSFQELHQFSTALFDNPLGFSKSEVIQTLEAGIIIGDLGKSQKARNEFARFGILAPDHDDFHHEFLKVLYKQPDLCPSYAALPRKAQRLLLESGHGTHFGHITHMEGKEAMFSPLKRTGVVFLNPFGFKLDFLIHLSDVCGALGHVNFRSSLVYSEHTHQAISKVFEACMVLQAPERTEKDAYDVYLNSRAKWLGLNPEKSIDRVLTRVGCMLRLFSIEDGKVLREAISDLSEKDQTRIAFELDQKESKRPTPTYVPAVLVNLSNHPDLGSTKEERLKNAITIGLPFVAKVFEEKGEVEFNGPLNFNPMAGIAKTNPFSIKDMNYQVNPDGMVSLKTNID